MNESGHGDDAGFDAGVDAGPGIIQVMGYVS